MRKFWRQVERIGCAVGRRGRLLTLVPALLLCAWLMTPSAYAADSTYLFEVTTGVRTTSGDEDKIDFFIITYTTEASGNKTVSKFLFPAKDGWKKTYDTLTALNNEQATHDAEVEKTYGYKGTELGGNKSRFQSYSTDQYLFTTPEPIKEVKRVQFFAGDSGSWNCRAMRIFHVTELGGLYRWNTATNDCYIDYAGDLIAEGTMKADRNLSWTNDKLISTKDENDKNLAATDVALKTSGFSDAYKHHARQDNKKKTLALRFDFADTYGSGLEALGAMSTSNNKLTNMGLAETMAVTLYYVDCYGMEHAAKVPAVLNAAEYTAGLLSGGDRSKAIAGFAQQGESMALGVFLPDYVSLVPNKGIDITLGASEARDALGLTALSGSPSGEAGTLRKNRITLSENDTASLVTLAVYDLSSAQISASVENDTIRYRYTGDPIYYQQVEFVSGNPLRVGANTISLTKYEHGKLLAPRDKTERYLLELTTDEVTGAGTKDDILMRVSWTDLEGNAKVSDTLNIRELSRDFNGWWYGTVNGSAGAADIAYYKGVATGKTLRFFVPLQNVKTITDIKVWMSGSGTHDDWQMSDLTVSIVNSYDKRSVSWQAFNYEGVSASLSFDRRVEAVEVYRYSSTTENPALVQQGADEETNVGPNRPGGGGNGSSGGSGGSGGSGWSSGIDVTEPKKVDWSKIRYSMTFQEASQELGFGKERYLYAVTVHVAGNSEASAEDGDCGSKNLFYFRLVFKNGTSGFVLANQQLPSDGFIAGASQTFYISTNQDYGDVTAVQIIPEDLSENSDMFDKLNIQSIDVKRESKAALVPVWTVSSVGWISIDYRDEAQMQSVTGMAGRDASEVTRTYTVDGSTFDVNFMIAIRTQGYPDDAPQFEGNLAAIVYYDSYSPSRGQDELADVTKSMYAYMNRTANMSDDIAGKTISDKNLMHRAGHTDRFYFSLSDVRSIKRIEFQVTSAVNTTWKISDVSLYMVNGSGSLILNKFGEYERVYREGEQLTELAHGTSDNSPAYAQILQAYDGTTNSSGQKVNDKPAVITVNFSENEIEINPDAKQWTSIISREPVSENDTLNVFLYPLDGARADAAYPPVTVIQYTNTADEKIQTSTGDMNRALYNDQPVFYVTGINAKKFGVLNSVVVYSGRGSGVNGSFRAVVQQIRSGVVIATYEWTGSGYSDPAGISFTGLYTPATQRQQRVRLQMGADVPTTVLLKETNDLAVAIWYRADDPSGMELRSPYVYLTDQGYTKISAGQVIDLTFDQKNVGEITGISVVSSGNVGGTIDAASIIDEEIGLETKTVVETKGAYGFTDGIMMANVPYRTAPSLTSRVQLLSISFTTAQSTESMSAGTDGPVRMTLGYYDVYGDLIEKTYADIRPYLTDGETGFRAGRTSTIQMLVDSVDELRWIELEPYSEFAQTDGEGKLAMWVLKELSATVGEGSSAMHRDVNTQIIEGSPLKLSMADILLTARVETTGADGAASEQTGKQPEGPQVISGTANDLLIESGESVKITPNLLGSIENLKATLETLDIASGATGKVSLADTRGYTKESIAQKAADARAKEQVFLDAMEAATTDSGKAAARRGADSAAAEAAMWEALEPQTGAWSIGGSVNAGQGATGNEILTLSSGNTILFTPPRNYTGATRAYRITIISAENSSARIVLNVTVGSETDPTTKTQEQLSQEMIDAQNAQSDAQNESNENLLKIIEELNGKLMDMQSQLDSMNTSAGADAEGTGG